MGKLSLASWVTGAVLLVLPAGAGASKHPTRFSGKICPIPLMGQLAALHIEGNVVNGFRASIEVGNTVESQCFSRSHSRPPAKCPSFVETRYHCLFLKQGTSCQQNVHKKGATGT